jgi:hypothetical protein
MPKTNRRGNIAWVLSMLVAFLVLLAAGEWPIALVLSAAVIFMTMLAFAGDAARTLQSRPKAARLVSRANPASRQRRLEITQAARRASEYAELRSDRDTRGYRLQDVGTLVEVPRRDGLDLRQARLVSLDDNSLRPYLVVDAPAHAHPRQTLVRFEIGDAAGQQQLVCEMEHYMRPGENLLLPAYRLPLKGNTRLTNIGKWDLQVWIDGGLVALHTFNMSPSMEDRRRQFGLDGEAQVQVAIEDDSLPISLEELLNQHQRRTSTR